MQPANPEAYNNMGMLYADLQQFDLALASYSKALELNPNSVEAYNNMGLLHASLRQFDQALSNYDKALVLNPEGSNITLNRSLALLSVGHYLEGWHDYESRLKQSGFSARFDKPLLSKSEDLRNKVVLVCAEQGYGDTVQFCRYVDLLAKCCRQVILRVPRVMVTICSTLISKPLVISDEGQPPHFDVYCFLMSLPFFVGDHIRHYSSEYPISLLRSCQSDLLERQTATRKRG